MKSFIVGTNESGQRLDKFLVKYLRAASKSFIYKMLRKKNITLNEKKATGSEKLAAGDKVTFWFSDETFDKFRGENIRPVASGLPAPDIIYEDEQIIIINKPAGLLSQKSAPEDVSVNEMLIGWLLDSGQLTKESLDSFRPSVCNRLDRNTSGLITGGKTLAGLQFLSAGFKERTIHKYYFCLVQGHVSKGMKLRGYLVKDATANKVTITQSASHHADYIETEYEPLAMGRNCTLLKVYLITGRTHQIRAHLAAAGHSIVGDLKYGEMKTNEEFRRKYGVRRQLLHAGVLEMPVCGGEFAKLSERVFTAPLPSDFKRVMKGEGISWQE